MPKPRRFPRQGRINAGRQVTVGGQPLRLSDFRRTLIDQNKWLGNVKRTREALAEQLRQFEKLEEVLDLLRSGLSPDLVANETGVAPNTVRRWQRGENLPQYLSERFYAQKQRERKPINIPKPAANDVDFAYVLGALCGNASIRRETPEIFLRAKDKAFVEAFRDKLSRFVPIKGKIIKKSGGLWEFTVKSVSAAQQFNRLTAYGKKPPLSYLRVINTRRAFARALFDSHGYMSRKAGTDRSRVLFSKSNPRILDFIKGVLTQEGIRFSCFSSKGVAGIAIDNQRAILKFFERIGFTKEL